MTQSFSATIEQLKKLIKAIGPAKLAILAVLVGLTTVGMVFLVSWTGPQHWQTLFSHLNAQDAAQIVERLKEEKTPYQLAESGTAILVPGERLYETRLALASQGLPRGSGVGFELFDETKLGMTEFVQNINYQRALQGELSRTINGFQEVESSRVHIAMPRQSLFVEEDEPATASVILKLRPGRSIGKEQVQGIVHLVSASVPRLRPEKITVVDNSGHILSGQSDGSAAEQLSAAQLEFQARVEKSIEGRVKTMLEKLLGQDKAIVRASCLLDFVRQEKTEEKFLSDNQVLRSEQILSETSNTAEKIPAGVPGLATNISENASNNGQNGAGGGKTYEKQDKTANYEIGKVTSHQIVPVGRLMKLSLAVIVDGTYRAKPVDPKNKRKKEAEELEYVPRSEQEIKRIESLVKGAINFDASRGDCVEVANIPFIVPNAEDRPIVKTNWLAFIGSYAGLLKYAAVVGFMLLAFVYIVRPTTRWLTSVNFEDLQMMQQLPQTIAQLERQYSGGPPPIPLPYRDRASQLISNDRQRTAELMQGWLKEG